MKKTLVFTAIFIMASVLWGQQKHALVIGNTNYKGISTLKNPVNDARDIETVLKNLGFTVETVLDGNLERMENAVTNLKRRLGSSSNSYGFFFYSGHGVQANGENYLIPVEANNILNETHLRQRAVSLQFIMDSLNEAGNQLNMIVLDACRDNPFSWYKSGGSRGLSVVSQAPSGSIVMYATAANSVASDGTGNNGLFTGHLLTNLRAPGLSVFEIFDNTMEDVKKATGGKQDPELSLRYSGANRVYLGTRPGTGPVSTTGSITITSQIAGEILIDVKGTGITVKEGGTVTVNNISTGNTEVAVKQSNGTITKATNNVMVRAGQTVAAVIERPAPANMVRIQGGTFTMGSPASEPNHDSDETPHQVTVGSFYMGRYQVTQKEYQAVMGTNPSDFKGDNLPVEKVSWYDAIVYCNKLSMKEGLSPAYRINGSTDPAAWGGVPTSRNATWDAVAIVAGSNGYRLPTEAQWEYACRAGTGTPFSTGNNITTTQANYDGNYPYNNNAEGTYREKTTAVGSFAPNAWGLYDMHGNVDEWCWDWYGSYASGAQTDPVGAVSGNNRVRRGGSWDNFGQHLRSACRGYYNPGYRVSVIGFRLVRP
jgi:formylglycine-generating enzyme required for sulfatase activity